MPACMTSELRELVPVPMASVASATSTSRPRSRGPRSPKADHARADHDAVDVGAHRRAPAADNACARERRVVMAFSWRRGRRRGEVEAAGMEDQRRLAAVAATLDFADHDDVIAFDVAAAVVAFEPGGAAAVQHRHAARRPRHGQAVEAVGRPAGGEAARQRDLVGAQHIDDVAIARSKASRDDEPPDRLHSTSGGFSDTE